MSVETAGEKPGIMKRDGRDHYVPQGNLPGFIDQPRLNSQQPLWHFDIHQNVWSQRSIREIGYKIGMYDYGSVNDTPEIAIRFSSAQLFVLTTPATRRQVTEYLRLSPYTL